MEIRLSRTSFSPSFPTWEITYKTLPVPGQNYLKYCICKVAITHSPLLKTKILEKFGSKETLWFKLSLKKYCWMLQFHFKYRIHKIKFRNWFMQEPLWSLVSLVKNHSTLSVSDEHYSQYYISTVVILLSLPITKILENFGKK